MGAMPNLEAVATLVALGVVMRTAVVCGCCSTATFVECFTETGAGAIGLVRSSTLLIISSMRLLLRR